MKTLHIDTGREMGGGQWQIVYLLEGLEGATLLAPQRSPLFEEARSRKIDVRPLSLPLLYRLARESDLVHAHDARAHSLAAALPGMRLPGTRLVVSRRVAFPVNRGIASRIKYARADLYLAVSRSVAGELASAGVAPEKIRVVHDGVPLADKAEGNEIVALAGKGVETIRRAAELARAEVRFATRLWDDLSKAKMFLYASEVEGLGSAALAAMSASVPVIASDIPGLREAVQHERTGLLAANRPEAFADAISRLLRDPGAGREMGKRGRERIEREFTIGHMIAGTSAAYREVLQ